MVFGWFNLIVLFGVVQGLLTAFLITINKSKTLSQKLTAAVLLVFSLLSCKIAIHTFGLWQTHLFRYFPLAIDLLIQPLLYFYVASLTVPGFQIKGRRLYHFVPVLIFLFHALIVYVAVLPISNLVGKDVIADYWQYDHIKFFEDQLSVISSAVYGLLSFRLITKYQKWLYTNSSDSRLQTMRWLKNVFLLAGALGIALLINILLDQVFKFSNHYFFHWRLFYIYLSLLIYYVAFRSYGINEQFLSTPFTHQIHDSLNVSRYSRQEVQDAKNAIVDALNKERLYLNSELTLNMLAAHLRLSPSLVSETINKDLGKSFRNLINELRVAEVKIKLLDNRFSHLSIVGIAFESGFNSEASFYRIFKLATGITPKVYLAHVKSDSTNPVASIS
jgi:AraC-like DNA-binding protein